MARKDVKKRSKRVNYMEKQRQASLKLDIVNDKPVPENIEHHTDTLYERQLQNWDD